MITDSQKEELRKKLEGERDALKAKIEEYGQPVNMSTDVEDLESEEADAAEEFSNNLAIAAAYRAQLEEVENALHKMDEEGYGMCEKCGGKISAEKIMASPSARYCASCEE